MKKQDLVLLDLFSGIGGFHKGLADAGFNFSKVYFSEIDRHAIANYKYNFNEAEYIGGVESILASGMERPNIITFGSPCQDFSLAGKRAGLDGSRSSLIEYALSAISHYRPDIFIWENVKGTFSSNNRQDFWSIIQAFANIGGYGLEWQLVNTSWLLPQNRERIYLVGHLASSFPNWKGIFPIGEDDYAFDQAYKANRNRVQAENCTTIGLQFGCRQTDTYIASRGHGFVEDSINTICPTIRGSSFEHNTAVFLSEPTHKHGEERIYRDIAPTIQARYGTGGDNIPYVNYQSDVKAVLTPNRVNKRQNGRRTKEVGEPSFTLTAQDQHGVSIENRIRRLTEIECERLQGFENDWTKLSNYDGEVKQISKTQRYKMIGNAVTASMVELIGSRIIKNYE